jgi:hypothetical protein
MTIQINRAAFLIAVSAIAVGCANAASDTGEEQTSDVTALSQEVTEACRKISHRRDYGPCYGECGLSQEEFDDPVVERKCLTLMTDVVVEKQAAVLDCLKQAQAPSSGDSWVMGVDDDELSACGLRPEPVETPRADVDAFCSSLRHPVLGDVVMWKSGSRDEYMTPQQCRGLFGKLDRSVQAPVVACLTDPDERSLGRANIGWCVRSRWIRQP